MGLDAQDWHRQVDVNVTETGQLPVDLKQQTATRIYTQPDQPFDKYEKDSIVGTDVEVTAGNTVSVGSESCTGCGLMVLISTPDPDIQYQVKHDNVVISSGNVRSTWETWKGVINTVTTYTAILQWDEENDVYSMIKDLGFWFPFSTSVELLLYNPTGSTITVTSVILTFIKER